MGWGSGVEMVRFIGIFYFIYLGKALIKKEQPVSLLKDVSVSNPPNPFLELVSVAMPTGVIL